ncbi:MAG: ABC transporter permease subunit [Acidimicrobiaceae bacterium]|nr:ABC transporter permease subunit [Acidimicrobiaceae bacterium]
MSTTLTYTSSDLAPASHARVRTTSALRAEWTKLRSVRSTAWTILALAGITLGVAAIAGSTVSSSWHTMSAFERQTFDPTGLSLRGMLFGQLVIGVLGILVMSAEYSTGTIRSTFMAVPNRSKVMLTKITTMAAVGLIVSEVLSFGAFFLGQSLLASPAPHAALSQPGVLRAVVGGGLVLTVLGLFALGLATIIRHSAAAITTYVGVLLVLPLVVQALPSSISQPVTKYLPFHISDAMTSVTHVLGSGPSLSPWTGFAVLCGYAFVALAVGMWMMVRRDA